MAVCPNCGHVYDTSLLTERQLELMRLVAEGKENAEIGAVLGISAETVRGTLGTVNKKLGAKNRTQAVMICVRRGLID